MHQVFDHKDFYAQLDSDLRSARFLVIIQSPFMTLRRVKILAPTLAACNAKGVRVCVFTQRIEKRYLTEEDYLLKKAALKEVTDVLSTIDVHVNTVSKIHEKLVIIDESVFWEGSLNPLSYRDTSERMTRWQCGQKVRDAMSKHNLGGCRICRQSTPSGDLPSTLGDVIAKRRKMLKISQVQFSEITGIAQSTLCRIEKGKYNCQLSTITNIFSALSLSCRPLLWYMLPTMDHELSLSLGSSISDAEELKELD
jgi:DNA-binding XRE family transcriptional regulator